MQIQKMISNIERKRRSRRQPSECQTKLF
jgi:hypothetical protein